MNILLNWINPNSNFWIEFSGKKGLWIIFGIEYFWKIWYWIILSIEFDCEMNEWIIFWIDICHFWWKAPFFCLFCTLFWHFSYSTSINDPLTIELNYLLNWISRVYFELNNILNWILGKAILNRILNESFFGKIQILNWIRLAIGHHYLRCSRK